jgi:hypothetical protein
MLACHQWASNYINSLFVWNMSCMNWHWIGFSWFSHANSDSTVLLLLLGAGGWYPWKYCSHVGIFYEPGFGSSRFHRLAPPRLRRRERPLAGKGGPVGEKYPVILLTNSPFEGIFYMPQICDMGPTAAPPKEGMLRIFSPWKIWQLRPGSDLQTWVPEASMLTPRPLKQLWFHHYSTLLYHCATALTTQHIITYTGSFLSWRFQTVTSIGLIAE